MKTEGVEVSPERCPAIGGWQSENPAQGTGASRLPPCPRRAGSKGARVSGYQEGEYGLGLYPWFILIFRNRVLLRPQGLP